MACLMLQVMRGAHACVGGFPDDMQVGEDFVFAQRLELLAGHLAAAIPTADKETVRYNRRAGNSL